MGPDTAEEDETAAGRREVEEGGQVAWECDVNGATGESGRGSERALTTATTHNPQNPTPACQYAGLVPAKGGGNTTVLPWSGAHAWLVHVLHSCS